MTAAHPPAAGADFDWPALQSQLAALPGAVVAFSGGVDSAVLARACLEVLGPDRTVAVIADSPSLARQELAEARQLARELGMELVVLQTAELEDARYAANAGDRCFWCKEALFTGALPLAADRGWAMVYGENADDTGDHRPGARSAADRGVAAPLRDAGWTKAMVRAFARDRGLPVADKPAAPCLASRLPVGVTVTRAALAQVERLESDLRAAGYRILRARHVSADEVRLEFGAAELQRALTEREWVESAARQAGYRTATIDESGYRRGSVNGVAV